jgi:hypothetical protein
MFQSMCGCIHNSNNLRILPNYHLLLHTGIFLGNKKMNMVVYENLIIYAHNYILTTHGAFDSLKGKRKFCNRTKGNALCSCLILICLSRVWIFSHSLAVEQVSIFKLYRVRGSNVNFVHLKDLFYLVNKMAKNHVVDKVDSYLRKLLLTVHRNRLSNTPQVN